jgi:GT2 family glycosyltransferase
MKSSLPARKLALRILADGVVQVRMSGPAPREVGIVLDGALHGMAQVGAAGRGQRGFTFSLPRHLAFDAIDIVSLPQGESLLGLPYSLAEAYDFRACEPRLAETCVVGGFAAAPWLADVIGIEFIDQGHIMARGLALRDRMAPGPIWRFEAPMLALLHPGYTARLRPRIGGRLLSAPVLPVTAADLGYAGCLDSANPEEVTGWAVDLRHPKRRVALEVMRDTDIVARLVADGHRDDLKKGGLGDGRCGFYAELPKADDAAARRRIGVRLAGRLTELAGSPRIVDPTPHLLGRFDTLHGMSVHGWAWDRNKPDEFQAVEVLGPAGEVLATAVGCNFRGDLLGAGIGSGLCAFKIDLSAHFERLIGQDIIVRVAGTDLVLPGSPQKVVANRNMQRFLRRKDVLIEHAGALPRLKRALNHRAGEAGISLIMPVHNTPRSYLSEALESVRHQFCDNWELICVDDGSTEPHVRGLLASYAKRDRRVRVLTSPENVGIARAVNFGLRAARYDYVAFLDHDDYLEPDAVWQLIQAARISDADLMYSDEALTDENLIGILEFRLRPAFSHDYYLSHPYFVHVICVRTEMARRIGGWDEQLAISGDVDFVLRALEASRKVAHVPAVLYRWRTHESSAGHAKKADVMAATMGALQRHLDRLGTRARVSEGAWFNQFRVDWPDPGGLILIVIPTKNGKTLLEKAVSSIEATAAGARYRLVVIDHESNEPATQAYLAEIGTRHIVMPYAGEFNFSRMNNQAVARYGADADFVLFLNNDIEATQAGWLARLRSLAHRSDVGAVGALLMYIDKRVQHAGVVVGFNASADHALRMQNVYLDENGRRNLGYNCSLSSVRDFSAVTGACLMMRREVFAEIEGFDETFGIGFNDTDLCLRLRDAGYRVLYDGYTMLYHYESATRGQTKQVFHPEDTARMTMRWHGILTEGDPFYNPNLSLNTQDHVLREDDTCRIVSPPRVTELNLRGVGPRSV